jgi:hypothetical protein
MGVGIMNSMNFSLLANSDPAVDDSQEMELMFRSLSFYIGPSGSTRFLDPVKSGPSASKTKTVTKSGSSVGSSSEVNSLVSLAAIENMQKKLKEFDETRGEPDVGVMSTHATVLVDSVGPPSAEVCRTAASFP